MLITDDMRGTAESCGPVQLEGFQKHVLDINEAAAMIGVTVACMRKWKRQKRGPTYFRAGKLIRYRRTDVERWIAQNSFTPELLREEPRRAI